MEVYSRPGQLEQRAPGLFLSPFDRASVAQLFIRANCRWRPSCGSLSEKMYATSTYGLRFKITRVFRISGLRVQISNDMKNSQVSFTLPMCTFRKWPRRRTRRPHTRLDNSQTPSRDTRRLAPFRDLFDRRLSPKGKGDDYRALEAWLTNLMQRFLLPKERSLFVQQSRR